MTENSTQSIYSGNSSEFAKRWETVHSTGAEVDRQHFWHVIRNERIYSLLESLEPNLNDKSLLELGCGNGNVIGYLCQQGISNCAGWDLNPFALKLAQQRFPSIQFERKDFLEDEPINRYDILGLFDLLEHLPNDVDVLRTIRRLANPGGRVIITVPSHQWLWSVYDDFYGHLRRYTKSTMVLALEQAGYSKIHCNYFMSPLVPILLFSRKRVSSKSLDLESEIDKLYRQESGLPPTFMNAVAKIVLRLEQKLLGFNDLGFGSSLIATATI